MPRDKSFGICLEINWLTVSDEQRPSLEKVERRMRWQLLASGDLNFSGPTRCDTTPAVPVRREKVGRNTSAIDPQLAERRSLGADKEAARYGFLTRFRAHHSSSAVGGSKCATRRLVVAAGYRTT
jgi:hypothetical protein